MLKWRALRPRSLFRMHWWLLQVLCVDIAGVFTLVLHGSDLSMWPSPLTLFHTFFFFKFSFPQNGTIGGHSLDWRGGIDSEFLMHFLMCNSTIKIALILFLFYQSLSIKQISITTVAVLRGHMSHRPLLFQMIADQLLFTPEQRERVRPSVCERDLMMFTPPADI